MKITSWNINSIRIRIPIIEKFNKKYNPDVICFQETKVEDRFFPVKELEKIGFKYFYFNGQKSYNGVAVISKFPLEIKEKIDILNYGQSRHISVLINKKIELHNFYVPAGGEIPDPLINDKFDHKLKFLDWMIDFFSNKKSEKLIILGDINIAPYPEDVWSHKALINVISHTPIETEKIKKLQQSANLIDCFRNEKNINEKLYSWWSYRARKPLESNRGRRLDHIWISSNLKQKLLDYKIFKEFRIEDRPSDHIPIMIDINN
jgi:exodeoxyribonuclease III